MRALEVREIIVMGHAMCGGIHALLHGTPNPSFHFVGGWIAMAEAARARVLATTPIELAQQECEYEAVKLSLDNLRTFPWIRDAVRDGRVSLHGTFFDIRTGILERLGAGGRFEPA